MAKIVRKLSLISEDNFVAILFKKLKISALSQVRSEKGILVIEGPSIIV